jgi:hypothetical protein
MFDISPIPIFYKNFCHHTVGWDEALNHLDKFEKDGGINDGSVVFKKTHGFISYKAERLYPVQPLLKILKDKVKKAVFMEEKVLPIVLNLESWSLQKEIFIKTKEMELLSFIIKMESLLHGIMD